jgi:class 3 adenylate cyclase
MACSLRLQEHLQHVSCFKQRRTKKSLESIKEAKKEYAKLLASMLPHHIVDQVRQGVSPIAEHHSCVTIVATDIKGFTKFSASVTPALLVSVLNTMYSAFDEIIAKWELHKVEIIGDAYLISAGCPAPDDGTCVDASEWAMRAVEVALAMQRTLPRVCNESSVQMRVGVHTGSVVAGVVGKKGPRYHLFGKDVGYAELMESTGIPGRVQVSDATHGTLEDGGRHYQYEERQVQVEDGDTMHRTWLVTGSNSYEAAIIQRKLMLARRKGKPSLLSLIAGACVRA